jgi:hypothetical protein
VLGTLATLAALGLVGAAIIGNGPEMDLQFTRDVPSKATVEALGAQVSDLSKWPEWFFSLKEARTVSATGELLPADQQKLFEGARVRLYIEPKKKQWKRFEMTVLVEAYKPNDFLRLRVLDDSKKKLSTMFENLVWQVNIFPAQDAEAEGLGHSKDGAPNLSLIRGQVAGRGISWRSKLFGTITPTILMAQVFYPDLIKLSETGFEQPKSLMSGVDGS